MMSDAILPIIKLGSDDRVLEIGGHGMGLLLELAKRNRNINGVIYDFDCLHELLEKDVRELHPLIHSRVKVVSGDYTEEIPEGFDTIIMKDMSAESSDERLNKILSLVKGALHPKSKIHMLDMCVDRNQSEYKEEIFWDNVVGLLNGGKLRSREEIEGFLERNGFKVTNVHIVKHYMIIDAIEIKWL